MTTKLHREELETSRFRLPDIDEFEERGPDSGASYDILHYYGISSSLAHYLGNHETTIVSAEHYIVPSPRYVPRESRYPDLVVALDAKPELYKASHGYVVTEQGKPPDFVLQIASRSTAQDDLEGKKDYFKRMGVTEYWLFDRTGKFYGSHLAGYRLVDGEYRSLPIRESPEGHMEGTSEVLGLTLRWVDGKLEWIMPNGEHIPTQESERERADDAALQAEQKRTKANREQMETKRESERADRAEARVQELEAELERLRSSQ